MLKRLKDLPRCESAKIRARQNRKRMTTLFDNDGYLCYESEEMEHWQNQKNGRKPKK